MSIKSPPRMNPAAGRWIMADLHVHSSYSGGSLTPPELVKNTQIQMLDAIAIMDHNQVAGAIEGQQIAAANSSHPEVIIGQEVSLGDHFHLLALGPQEAWTTSNRSKLLERIHHHHNTGGVIILAHPWTMPRSSWASGCLHDLLAGKLVDGIELFNSAILEFRGEGPETLTSIWENLIIPYQLGVVGGSDFHYHKQGRYLGTGRTYLKVFRKGSQGIIDALRNRRSVAGLFSYRPFDLGKFGAGTETIIGRDPWYNELRELIANLNHQIKCSGKYNPFRQTILKRLMATGHYQTVRDLLNGGYPGGLT